MVSSVNSKLMNTLSSSAFKNQLSEYLTDDKLSFAETKQFLNSVKKDGMTTAKLKDLNTIWSYNTSLFSDDYTKHITGYFITGCNANSFWWGGLDQSGKSELGNLSTTTPQSNLEKLINKWFAGTDVPLALVGGDTAAGISGNFSFNYAPFSSGVLYKDGVSASDVNQGSAGTCYFLACLGAVANANPSYITKDFIRDNGDDTYGFRFFNANSEAYYVTVDKNLAIDKTTNQPVLANPSNGELWVALAEKAYAQINSQANVLLRSQSDNSYQAIEGGMADPLKQITGLNYRYYCGYNENISDTFSYTGTKYSQDPKTYKNEIISLLQNGSIGTLGVTEKITDKNGNYELFPGHAFMLLGYDAKTDTFKIRNPWGDRGDVNGTIADYGYVPEFNLSIESFWNIADIQLTDVSLKNLNYNYTIKSDTGTSKNNAISEGQAAYLSVQRDSPNMTSVIYYGIQPNSTKGPIDQPVFSKVAIDFMQGNTFQHLAVPIYTDSIKEGIESFDVNFYKSFFDATPFTKTTLFVKDGLVDKSIYVLTNVDSEVVKEGQVFTLKIERSDTSIASTVYIDTVDQTATGTDVAGEVGSGNYTVFDSDYIKLHKTPVDFKVGQKTATIDIHTIPDFKTEGTETFSVNLYKYFTDINASTNGVVQIADDATLQATSSYHYSMTSDAASENTGKGEGDSITFTVKRDGTGTESSIFLTSEIGSAVEGVDYLFKSTELKFSSDQDTLTFSVETLPDNLLEATELLNIGLRTSSATGSPDVKVSGYIKNVDETFYNYVITSSAVTSDLSVEEGSDIVFTITRDKSGTESTIYVHTFDGLAISESDNGACDYENIYEQEVTFLANETTKTIVVKTYADSNTIEGVEDLNVGIYNFKSDTTYSSYTRAYIHDIIPDNYSYSLDEEEYDVIQGDPLTVTITRSSNGTPSSVFLWTDTGMATEEDFQGVDGLQIDFGADETSKTIVIDTLDDALTDEQIYEDFGLYLYKYYGDDDDGYIASSDVWIMSNAVHEIDGSDENDTLIGTDMQDDIYGLEGDDKIVGGAGQDIMTGDEGNDIFIFTSVDDSLPDLADILVDFTKGDKIDLSAIDANITTSKDDEFSKPTMGAQFSGKFTKPGQLFFDTTDEILYGNVDADSGADFAIEFIGITKLIASSLVL
ncbi:hypothetical protein LBMAG43_07620 [Methylococcaceae bacterium]|nr:hypothetical protein LBMAG43_07620 [Methylococcaceae bacterium]